MWRALKFLVCHLMIALSIQTNASAEILSPWPKAGHDPQNTRKSEYRGPEIPVIITKVRLVGQEVINNSGITIGSDGTFYVGTWGHSYISGLDSYSDGKMYAIDKDGNIKWCYDPGIVDDGNILRQFGTIETTPALDPEDPSVIYFGRGDGRLFSLKDNGYNDFEVRWIYDTTRDSEWGRWFGRPIRGGQIFTSPAVGPDGRVYFAITKAPGTDTAIYAVDKDSGRLCWRYPEEGSLASNKIVTNPVIGNGYVYFATKRNIYAFELYARCGIPTGPVWTYAYNDEPLDYFFFTGLMLRGYRLFANSASLWKGKGKVFVINARSGKEERIIEFDKAVVSAVVGNRGRVYVSMSDYGDGEGQTGSLLILNYDGEIIKRIDFNDGISTITLDKHENIYLYLGGNTDSGEPGSVYSYTMNGDLRWGPLYLDAPVMTSPISIDGMGRLVIGDAPCKHHDCSRGEDPKIYIIGDIRISSP
jgi:outer membrane protein assembly factor BamB